MKSFFDSRNISALLYGLRKFSLIKKKISLNQTNLCFAIRSKKIFFDSKKNFFDSNKFLLCYTVKEISASLYGQ